MTTIDYKLSYISIIVKELDMYCICIALVNYMKEQWRTWQASSLCGQSIYQDIS